MKADAISQMMDCYRSDKSPTRDAILLYQLKGASPSEGTWGAKAQNDKERPKINILHRGACAKKDLNILLFRSLDGVPSTRQTSPALIFENHLHDDVMSSRKLVSTMCWKLASTNTRF